jgi:hypothetical protein
MFGRSRTGGRSRQSLDGLEADIAVVHHRPVYSTSSPDRVRCGPHGNATMFQRQEVSRLTCLLFIRYGAEAIACLLVPRRRRAVESSRPAAKPFGEGVRSASDRPWFVVTSDAGRPVASSRLHGRDPVVVANGDRVFVPELRPPEGRVLLQVGSGWPVARAAAPFTDV